MSVPRRYRWSMTLFAGGLFVGVLVGMAVGAAHQMGGGSFAKWFADGGWVYFAPFGAIALVGGIMLSPVRREVVRMKFLCCERCGYDLSKQQRLADDPGGVRCPECGELWGVDALKEIWRGRSYPKSPNVEQ